MTIQPINSYPIQSSIRTDFQNFGKSFQGLADATKSGNQDQITLSENALQQAMTQVQTDVSSFQQVNATNQTQSQDSLKADFQNLLTTLNAAQDATKSGDQTQINSSQTALQQAMAQFQTDVSSLQPGQGHHHHHHHHHQVNAANSNFTMNNLLSSLGAATGYGSSGQSQSTASGTGLNITT
jgi:hypothetical protein